jgi:hypothetical protein
MLACHNCECGGSEGGTEAGCAFWIQEKTWDLNSYHHFPEKQQYFKTHCFECIL